MTKPKNIRTYQLSEVPPFCFLSNGLTPEEAAREAVKQMGMKHPIDALMTLWTLRGSAAPADDKVTVKWRYLRDLRKECGKYRRQPIEIKEKAGQERAELDLQLIQAKTTVAAARAGLIDLDAVIFLDFSEISINETGELIGADLAIGKLKKSKPHFFQGADS